MRVHLKKCDGSIKRIPCSKCDLDFKRQEDMEAHALIHYGQVLPKTHRVKVGDSLTSVAQTTTMTSCKLARQWIEEKCSQDLKCVSPVDMNGLNLNDDLSKYSI